MADTVHVLDTCAPATTAAVGLGVVLGLANVLLVVYIVVLKRKARRKVANIDEQQKAVEALPYRVVARSGGTVLGTPSGLAAARTPDAAVPDAALSIAASGDDDFDDRSSTTVAGGESPSPSLSAVSLSPTHSPKGGLRRTPKPKQLTRLSQMSELEGSMGGSGSSFAGSSRGGSSEDGTVESGSTTGSEDELGGWQRAPSSNGSDKGLDPERLIQTPFTKAAQMLKVLLDDTRQWKSTAKVKRARKVIKTCTALIRDQEVELLGE
jgi:hypothetical protein